MHINTDTLSTLTRLANRSNHSVGWAEKPSVFNRYGPLKRSWNSTFVRMSAQPAMRLSNRTPAPSTPMKYMEMYCLVSLHLQHNESVGFSVQAITDAHTDV